MARFLFPEDERQILDICALIVQAEGFILDGVENGAEAESRVGAIEYDAIVSDGSMPLMSGPEFLERVRESTVGRVPCALKTAHTWATLEEMGVSSLGVGWYVQKPFQFAELVEVCNSMLETRVRWLEAARPDVVMPLRKDGRWVEIEALERAVKRRCDQYGGEPETWEDRRTLHVPSPFAAVSCLASTVRSWSQMLSGPGGGRQRPSDWEGLGDRTSPGGGDITRSHTELVTCDSLLRDIAGQLPEPLRTRVLLALCCARYGWRWMVDRDVDLVVDPPVEVHSDGAMLHSESGPAIRYRDGFQIYALHGVRVEPYVITDPDRITIREIRGERNAEVRRVMRERYGEGRYLEETGARLIFADSVPVDALVPKGDSITRALIEDDEGQRFLVASDGSTRRVYHMRVPRTCETCQDAYVALSGRADVRTIIQA